MQLSRDWGRCLTRRGQQTPAVRAAPACRRSCTVRAASSAAVEPAQQTPAALQDVLSKFHQCSDAKQRYQLVLEYADSLPRYPEQLKRPENRVLGCAAQAWVDASLDSSGKVQLRAASDSKLTAGLAGVLVSALSGLTPEQLLSVDGTSFLNGLNLGPGVVAPSRASGAANLLASILRRTRVLTTQLPRFPSLLISSDSLQPQGAFAEAQAQFLQPDAQQVKQLAGLLRDKGIGVVAHFYMDPQVQGVLSAAAEQWPHIHISDSLVMADAAVKMAQAGCSTIAVLGVDFMSENVRAVLDEAGLTDVQVYRMATDDIGCSLAEAAESADYTSYLQEAARTPSSLHVVYINTSLRTKAVADSLVPTITCTSSNVVQTVLQGFAQVPDLTVWYGPDTYMGSNLAQLFRQLADMPDEVIQELHPAHTAASVRELLPRFKHFANGTCIVHHIFGGETCELVRQAYGDAYLTAHFEVPGEMFTLAMEAKARGMGVVGSTSNILDFIAAKLSGALQESYAQRLVFVLGTESGMITSIVRKVQGMLREANRQDLEVEIVFPVNPQAITTQQQGRGNEAAPIELPGSNIAVLPGAAAGEGCSLQGGCASCPYMKMNSLDALMTVAQRVGSAAGAAMLQGFKPRAYQDKVNGMSMAQAGCVPILHMRHFSQQKQLSDDLVKDVTSRNAAAVAGPVSLCFGCALVSHCCFAVMNTSICGCSLLISFACLHWVFIIWGIKCAVVQLFT
ncbi:hypothetical protein COO60DRAFT_1287195 [Scenedesmus sp. NREL 46B-D3]|nr:hypothetical protein COO60DRAFT_1287195 [Scenedesmus sp. NREL 46B-D3]